MEKATAVVSSVTSVSSSQYNPPVLDSFLVFTPLLGQKEGMEHQKLLFYMPSTVELDEKVKAVGLCEAIINFTGTFSEEKNKQAVHRRRVRQAYLSPEPDYWMTLTMLNPSTVTSSGANKSVEWHDEELDDLLLQAILNQVYRIFRLFNGRMTDIVKTSSVETLRHKLALCIPKYLSTINFQQLDIYTTLEGIHFLPVDKNVYLRIQCFINLTENTFPDIKYSSFLYKDHLVWSGLEQDDIRVLYNYLFAVPSDDRQSRDVDIKDSSYPYLPSAASRPSGFLLGPESLDDPRTSINAPRVFIGASSSEQYHLVLYQKYDITCAFLINSKVVARVEFYKNLITFMLPQLNFLAPIISEHYARKQGYEETYRYVYFNHMNLALKSSLKQKSVVIPKEILKIINEIHDDFERSSENVSEVMVQTANDSWVVGRKSDQRELFAIFDNKNAKIIEVNDEMRKLSTTYFGNIFIDWH